MLWIAPLLVALAGTSLLAYLAAQVRREIPPTEKVVDEFGRTLRPALVRTRDEAARTGPVANSDSTRFVRGRLRPMQK